MDASLLMKQIKELRLEAKLFAGGAAGFAIPEFIDNAKDAAEYVISATLWTPQLKYPGAKEYAEKYKKNTVTTLIPWRFSLCSMYVMKDTLGRAKNWTKDGIRDAMKTTNMKTAFGPVKFEDREGYQNQNFMDTLVIQIQKGNSRLSGLSSTQAKNTYTRYRPGEKGDRQPRDHGIRAKQKHDVSPA